VWALPIGAISLSGTAHDGTNRGVGKAALLQKPLLTGDIGRVIRCNAKLPLPN